MTEVKILWSVLHGTCTIFTVWKFENIAGFVLNTFNLIYLAQNRSKMFYVLSSKSSTFFMDLKSINIPCFVLHTFHLIYQLSTEVNYLWSVLHDTCTIFKDLKYENIPSFVLPIFHSIYLAQDGSKFSIISPPPSLYILLCIWIKFEITLFLQCLELHVSSLFTFRPIKGPKYFN